MLKVEINIVRKLESRFLIIQLKGLFSLIKDNQMELEYFDNYIFRDRFKA